MIKPDRILSAVFGYCKLEEDIEGAAENSLPSPCREAQVTSYMCEVVSAVNQPVAGPVSDLFRLHRVIPREPADE